MKKIHKLLPAIAMALAGSEASAQVLYEPFNYTVGDALDGKVAPNGQTWSSLGTGDDIIVAATNLAVDGYCLLAQLERKN